MHHLLWSQAPLQDKCMHLGINRYWSIEFDEAWRIYERVLPNM